MYVSISARLIFPTAYVVVHCIVSVNRYNTITEVLLLIVAPHYLRKSNFVNVGLHNVVAPNVSLT
jgi:general stress protein CsbA